MPYEEHVQKSSTTATFRASPVLQIFI